MSTHFVDARTLAALTQEKAPMRVCRKPLLRPEYDRRLALIAEGGSLHRIGLVTLRHRGPVDPGVANVPMLGVSGEGPDWGYIGFAPADLALSVTHALLPPVPQEVERAYQAVATGAGPDSQKDLSKQTVTVGPEKTRISLLAYRLHIPFMCRFLVWMPEAGGIVSIDVIKQWVADESRVLAFQETQPEGLLHAQDFLVCWD